jgi:hypothetical protein
MVDLSQAKDIVAVSRTTWFIEYGCRSYSQQQAQTPGTCVQARPRICKHGSEVRQQAKSASAANYQTTSEISNYILGGRFAFHAKCISKLEGERETLSIVCDYGVDEIGLWSGDASPNCTLESSKIRGGRTKGAIYYCGRRVDLPAGCLSPLRN